MVDVEITWVLENYTRAFDPIYLQIFIKSLWMATATTFICLLVGFRPRAAATAAVALHAVLTGVVVTTLLRGVEVANCGCFGVFLARPLSVSTLIEDGVMLALSGLCWWLAPRRV